MKMPKKPASSMKISGMARLITTVSPASIAAGIRPDAWAEIADPEARQARALTAVYAHYRRNRVLLSVMADETSAEFAAVREAGRPMLVHAHAVLGEGWPVSESARPRLLTAIAHAFSFWAWVSMTDLGLSDDEAAALMLDMVRGVVNSRDPT